jgi:predicted ATPase
MPMPSLSKLTIKGFKSIRELDGLDLRRLNVLIGANGAGKSNFISFFRLLHELIEGRLRLHVGKQGGPDALLHYGRRATPQLEVELYFSDFGYLFTLTPTTRNEFIFADERVCSGAEPNLVWQELGEGQPESQIPEHVQRKDLLIEFISGVIKSWRIYHFHDTSEQAAVKQIRAINDNLFLRSDASNLAAFLYRLRQEDPATYSRIRSMVRLVMPSFDDFVLRPTEHNANFIALEWREHGSDYPFTAHQLSDGTLRFICLATLLLQPHIPYTVLIDEPELGLHPYALNVFASLLRSASARTQLIIATQSVPLVDMLELEDLIVVERAGGQSTFKRLATEDFKEWLEEYSLGELWMKNVLGGRPSR